MTNPVTEKGLEPGLPVSRALLYGLWLDKNKYDLGQAS